MNSLTAVLLALVLIVVILLIVWLVLRSRASDVPRGATTAGASAGMAGTDPTRTEGGGRDTPAAVDMPDPEAHDGQADAGAPTGVLGHDTTSPEGHELSEVQAGDGEAATAEEFIDPGLSELDAEPSEADGAGGMSGPSPQTPAEAFGSPDASSDAATHEAALRETSVLDEPDVDSTPLFRTIREERLAAMSPDRSSEPNDTTAEEGLAVEVVAEQPDVALTWSHERRAGDEQVGAQNDAALEGAPDVEEEQLVEVNEEAEDTVEVGSGVAAVEPPSIRLSEIHEVVDGGFGIGSAATISGGAQPLGHPIKANVDTKTYQDLHSPRYDETEPDVWFLDAGFAERAGFRRAE